MTRRASATECLDLATTWGTIHIEAAAGRIFSCKLPVLRFRPKRRLACRGARIQTADARTARVLRAAESFVRRSLAGQAARRPPLGLPGASSFTRRVWRALLRVPRGSTVTYGALASKIGCGGAARAVGRACRANPLPMFIPCHRVVAADGSLGGYSSGRPWKMGLLEREGVRVSGQGVGRGSSRRSR